MKKSEFFDFITSVPKAEIHLHSEAVVSTKTIGTLYKKHFNKEMTKEDDYDDYEDVDFVLDTENEESYNLKDGIDQLMQGLDCIENIENCNLSVKETMILNKLLERIGLPGLYDYCTIPMEVDYD